jgi:hypothetical protein
MDLKGISQDGIQQELTQSFSSEDSESETSRQGKSGPLPEETQVNLARAGGSQQPHGPEPLPGVIPPGRVVYPPRGHSLEPMVRDMPIRHLAPVRMETESSLVPDPVSANDEAPIVQLASPQLPRFGVPRSHLSPFLGGLGSREQPEVDSYKESFKEVGHS